ncbi:MAG: hypothetical protein ACXQS8_06470 [Candidatus Helarchaeales archaeon]
MKLNNAIILILAVACSVSFILTLLLSSIFYAIQAPFSILTHWISNLGIGPSPCREIFMCGLLISNLFFMPFPFIILKLIDDDEPFSSLLLLASAWTLLGVEFGLYWISFPADTHPNIHALGAWTFFSCSFVGFLFNSLGLCLNDKYKKIGRIQLGLVAFYAALLIIDGLLILFFVPPTWDISFCEWMLNVKTFVSQAGPSLLKLNEWLMAFITLACLIFLFAALVGEDE